MGARILIIEDEEPIRRGLCDVLAYHGHSPEGVGDGSEGLQRALASPYDLLMVDVMLPGVDGFSLTEQVRAARPGQAILLLTARGSEADVLRGFSAGADDYVTKPFSVAQLLARVQALLRRVGAAAPARFTLGPATVDGAALRVEVHDRHVDITTRDLDVLAYFAQHAGRVLSREDLLRDVWGYERVDRVETRCVDMAISKLRRRLQALTAVELIETVRGAGYRTAG